MNKNIPHNNNLINSEEGWLQMQILLDQRLPSKPKKGYSKSIVFYSAAAVLIIILLCISLQLDNISLHIISSGKMHTPQLTAHSSTKVFFKQRTSVSLVSKIVKRNLADKDKIFLIKNPGNATASETIDDFIGKRIDGKFEIELAQKQIPAAVDLHHSLISLHDNDNRSKATGKTSWDFFGGVGLNANMINTPRLQPYPLLEARYNLNRGFYLAIGLSAWSPVSTTAGGISKTVYLNDTVNNIRLYNEITSYKHLRYADIPLSAGFNITKHFSVLGGIQMSILMNKQTGKILKPYDYGNNITGTALPVIAGAVGGEQQYNVTPKKTDYRFISGLRYTKGKITGGLTYQHAFNRVANGSASGSNNLISVSVMFKIK